MRVTYKALSKDGRFISGLIEAKDLQEAVKLLRGRNFLPVSVVQKKEISLLSLITIVKKSHFSELVFFTRQLSSMLTSGITLIQSLSILKEQIPSQFFKDIISTIVVDIEEGKSLSQALAKYPNIFSPVYIAIIKAGEASGFLDKVTLRLADNLEKEQELQNNIKSALLYPAIVVAGIIVVLAIMMIFVVPQFTLLYTSLNLELPLTTRIVIFSSTFVSSYWIVLVLVVFLLVYLFKRWKKTPTGNMILDELSLRVPIFGNLFRQIALTEITRTLGLMINTGNLVVDSLQKAADVAGNVLYKNAIIKVSQEVERGVSIADAMRNFQLFPPILVQTVKIGEESGKLDESLLKASSYFEKEVDRLVKSLTIALEPLIIIILGVIVAFIIFSIISPIYKLVSAL